MEKLSWYIAWILHHSKFVLIADATICFKNGGGSEEKTGICCTARKKWFSQNNATVSCFLPKISKWIYK